ncbi:MAG: site-specific DNA-methyltransferase [Methanoregulaceae archaeon]|nr:site-specific DNA-methyltransferase [Methanoregulaceae archaeon]
MDEPGPDIRCAENGVRRLTSEIGETPSPGDLLLTEVMNRLASGGGFSLRITGTAVEMQVHSLDPGNFKQNLTSQIAEVRKSSDIHEDAFQNLVMQIENIRSYGIRNGKRIYNGYNAERKVKNRRTAVAQRRAGYYAIDNVFSREIHEIPPEFENAIICGDSSDILRTIPAGCIDLVVTSPPYNFGLGYDASADGISWEQYFSRLFTIFDECIRVLKYGGRIIVNVQPLFSDNIPSHHVISSYFMQKKMLWKGEVLWEKNNYNCKYTAWGSWKSPSNPYLKYTWEFIEIFSKGELTKRGDPKNIDITAEEFKKWVNAKWAIAPARDMKKYGHPAMFPEELVERLLKLFSYQNDIILDPFNGVGTTTVIAKKLRRRYLGIDISEEYCRKARQRLQELQDNTTGP